ncbi:MAG: hypothetical protein ACRDEA_09275 [Microcystaceae cyanobacterium]
MSHFNLKSLSFYGIAIGSVVLLFKVVTAYGDSSLKAPPSIGGRYRLQAQNLPQCLASEPLFLTIQQSGIYLNGALFLEPNQKTAEERLSLSGKWQNPSLNLSGSVAHLNTCHDLGNPVNLQASWEKDTLRGQINFGASHEKIEFTAQKEAQKNAAKSEH